MTTARIGNFTMGFGGLFLPLFNIQFHGFPDARVSRATSSFPHGFNAFHGGHVHGLPQPSRGQQADNILKNRLLLIGLFVILTLLFW